LLSSVALQATLKQKGVMKRRKRLSGGGRVVSCPELEHELFDWIICKRSKSLRVSRRAIREKAKILHPIIYPDGTAHFKASVGWLDNFMKRHGLSLRRRTTLAKKDPIQMESKIISFIMYVSTLVGLRKLLPSQLIAMDETSL